MSPLLSGSSAMGSGKPRGINAARKLRTVRRENRWAQKAYKKAHLGTQFKCNPFGGSSHCKGIVLEKMCALPTHNRVLGTGVEMEDVRRPATRADRIWCLAIAAAVAVATVPVPTKACWRGALLLTCGTVNSR